MADSFDIALKAQFASCISMPNLEYQAEVSSGGYRFKAIAVVAYTVRQSYLESMFEEVQVTVVMQPSHYSQVVLHGHENTKLTLVHRPWGGGGKPIVRDYHAVLVSHRDEALEGNKTNIGKAGIQDMTNFSIVTFQLLSPALYNLRMREVGGIFKNTTAVNVLTTYLANMKLGTDYSLNDAIGKINIDDIASTRLYKQIKIPEGMPFMALADYLQQYYGIFPTGMGIFLKEQTWYVFSPYGLQKKYADVRRLVIFNAPPGIYRSVERNFRVEGKTTTIIATGPTIQSKTSDAEALNGGTGIRFGMLDVIDGGISPENPVDDPITRPDNYMQEYSGVEYKNPYNKTVMSKTRFTDNGLWESSKMASRGGQLVKVIWENGFIDPLVPGMPVTFHYGQNDKLQTLDGTLVDVEYISNIPLNGFVEPKHQGTVSMTLFLKSVKDNV